MLFLKTDKRPYHYWKFFISFGIIPSIFGHLTLPYLSKSKSSRSSLKNSSPCHFSSRYALYLHHIVRTIDDDHSLPETYQWGLAPVIGVGIVIFLGRA